MSRVDWSLKAWRGDREPIHRAALLPRGRLLGRGQKIQASVQRAEVFVVGQSTQEAIHGA